MADEDLSKGTSQVEIELEARPTEFEQLKEQEEKEKEPQRRPRRQTLSLGFRTSTFSKLPANIDFEILPFATKLRRHAKERSSKISLFFFFFYFIWLIVFLTMEAYPPDQYEMDALMRSTFIDEPFNLYRTQNLMDIDSKDELMDWIYLKYIPVLWGEGPRKGYITDLTRIALPPVVGFFRNIEVKCTNQAENDTCLEEDAVLPDIELSAKISLNYAQCEETISMDDLFVLPFWNTTAKEHLPLEVYNEIQVQNTSQAVEFFQRLEPHLTRSVRRLKFEMIFYNPITDFIGVLFLVFYISPTGLVVPFASAQRTDYAHFPDLESVVQSYRVINPSSRYDAVQIFFQVMFLFMTGVFFLFTLQDIVRSSRIYGAWWKHYFHSADIAVWNWLDLITYLDVGAIVVLKIYLAIVIDFSTISNPSTWDYLSMCGTQEYSYFSNYVNVVTFARAIQTFLVLIVLMRVFKYLRLYHQTAFITATLGKAASDLASFVFIFLIVVIGYTFALYYYFGHSYFRFSRPILAFEQTLTLLLGNFDYTRLSEGADNTYGIIPFIFYWSLIFIGYFILVNIFLAIVLGAYESVKQGFKERAISEHMVPLSLWSDIIKDFITIRKPYTQPWHFWFPEATTLRVLSKKGYLEEILYSLATWECTVPLSTSNEIDAKINRLVLGFTIKPAKMQPLVSRKKNRPLPKLYVVFSRTLISEASLKAIANNNTVERIRIFGIEGFGEMKPLDWKVQILDKLVIFGFTLEHFDVSDHNFSSFGTLGCEIFGLEFAGDKESLSNVDFELRITADLNLVISEVSSGFYYIPSQPTINSKELVNVLMGDLPSTSEDTVNFLVTRFALKYSLPSFLVNAMLGSQVSEKK